MDEKTIAEKLVRLRGNKTQEDVAKELKISKSALCMYETGRRIPRDQIKIRIAKYYGVSIEEIFFAKENHEM